MENTEGFFIYDNLTFGPLNKLDWEVSEIPWTKKSTNWSQFDAVVIRSTWDYQDNASQFINTLEEIDHSGTLLLNPLQTCKWNINKKYLDELSQQGVQIVPTIWLDQLDRVSCTSLFQELSSHKIVVKPLVSANANDTLVLKKDDSKNWELALKTFQSIPLMAQPFVDSITTVGEYSLFYFDREFSHATLKTPKKGDFRVQEEHGGTFKSVDIDSRLQTAAESVINKIAGPLLYARVDLVLLPDGSAALMELELIEPSLYFTYSEGSANRFAKALDSMAK